MAAIIAIKNQHERKFPTSIEDPVKKTLIIPEYDTIIESKSATISDIFSIEGRITYFDEEHNKDELILSTLYYQKILEAFENKWGKILFSFIQVEHGLALILTEKNHLFHIEETSHLPTAHFLNLCDKLTTEAMILLKDDELQYILDLISGLISHLFSSLIRMNKQEITHDEHQAVIDYLITEYDKIRDIFQKSAQRVALLEYYEGMSRGIVFVLIISIIFGSILYLFNSSVTLVITILGSLVTGGIGAIISVMTRMSSGTFSLDYSAGFKQNNRLGVFRPIIGATMGIVIYFLLMSGLLPFDIKVNGSTLIYYVLCVAFSAGFTERWVQELLPGGKNDKSNDITPTNKSNSNPENQ
jgi:hypothetical protein